MAKPAFKIDAPAKRRSAQPVPAASPTAQDKDLALLDSLASDEDIQGQIDQSVTADFEGIGAVIHGVRVRPLSLSVVMLLHHLGNEIVACLQVQDMANSVLACAQFLFVADEANDLDAVTRIVFGDREEATVAVAKYAQALMPSDSLVYEIIDYINASTATRVTAKLPKELEGGTSSGNASRRHGQ